jgi:hypothetical protein
MIPFFILGFSRSYWNFMRSSTLVAASEYWLVFCHLGHSLMYAISKLIRSSAALLSPEGLIMCLWCQGLTLAMLSWGLHQGSREHYSCHLPGIGSLASSGQTYRALPCYFGQRVVSFWLSQINLCMIKCEKGLTLLSQCSLNVLTRDRTKHKLIRLTETTCVEGKHIWWSPNKLQIVLSPTAHLHVHMWLVQGCPCLRRGQHLFHMLCHIFIDICCELIKYSNYLDR